MTIKEINERVTKIAEIADDPEYAHMEEDKLLDEVLKAIAGGHPRPKSLAAAALKANEIEFSRWYA